MSKHSWQVKNIASVYHLDVCSPLLDTIRHFQNSDVFLFHSISFSTVTFLLFSLQTLLSRENIQTPSYVTWSSLSLITFSSKTYWNLKKETAENREKKLTMRQLRLEVPHKNACSYLIRSVIPWFSAYCMISRTHGQLENTEAAFHSLILQTQVCSST